jgi:hypothetical protein
VVSINVTHTCEVDASPARDLWKCDEMESVNVDWVTEQKGDNLNWSFGLFNE